MSYGQNSDFQDGGRRHLQFKKNEFLVTWLQWGSTFAVVYQISSKLDNFSLRYGDLTIFKIVAVRHLEFKNLQFLSCSLCRHAVLLPHTKFSWNRTIGWWVIAKKAIFKMAAAVILNFKNFNFCHVTVIGFNICCSVPNSIKIGWFHWDMVI